MGRRTLLRGGQLAGALWLALSTQGCQPTVIYPTAPTTYFRPTIVGLYDHRTRDNSTMVLTSGVTITDRTDPDMNRLGDASAKGDLIVASLATPKFVDAFRPIESRVPGCWEAWPGQSDRPLLWEEGNFILLPEGVLLPEAAQFESESEVGTRIVNGRTVFMKDPDNQSTRQYEVCVNASAQVEWVKFAR